MNIDFVCYNVQQSAYSYKELWLVAGQVMRNSIYRNCDESSTRRFMPYSFIVIHFTPVNYEYLFSAPFNNNL